MSGPGAARGPVHRERLPGRWDPPALQSGRGVIVEGELVDISRHLIVDIDGGKERCSVLYVRPSRAQRRWFDAQGNEREPNVSDTRKVNTGFLLSSFSRSGGQRRSGPAVPEELKGLVNKPELLSVTERHTPNQAVAFWLLEAELEALELELGTEIRLKTRGDSPFVFSLAKLQAGTVTRCHVVGDGQAGASWTEHVLAHRAQVGPSLSPGAGDGAEDDEWDA